MDIKTELLKPVDDIFTDKSTMYLVQVVMVLIFIMV